ncbi:methyl-accepting chemotaxis protein [Trinickia caryophylli]|uniref:Methyl-accepting chemotaxis sensory transducer with TarH sensor n=1 Tax=Trinickia caryophylli TaxID=28094 RepID=A0A1X7DME8_TRICW|nr:methyl-accepting chemotaxis protein [Trinickia caryophylli]PMS10641.1 HAMP domain-containing protein [Trinickia caryophylli]TRX17174.1 HAMP domain-containing protein [Trinickia caryophylli]WQE12091.1 methyl-accepting chemotaxis protein [Trinickia caryophylli]SMF18308.1 methyl-accepting chemotaxis sensory transducer with TarH sensor [Trinickia caryophylli]
MLNRLTIRGGLTLTIAGYTLALMATMAIAMLGLGRSNDALRQMYETDTAALTHLKLSSERMLQVRLALSSYETLFAMGEASDDMLPKAHGVLKESDKAWAEYLRKPRDDEESKLADAVGNARSALIAQAVEPEFKALQDNDFNAFRTVQGRTANQLYARYDAAIGALEALQMRHQQARYDRSQQNFRTLAFAAAIMAFVALVIGVIARTAIVAAVVKPIDSAIRHFERIAAGDLTGTIDASSNNEMGRLMVALQRMQAALGATVARVRTGSEAIMHGAREIASGNADLSQRTEQQAASLAQTASSMEELTSTVKQNADHAREASQLAHEASRTATVGGEVVGDVVRTMEDIATSSNQIGDISGVIEGIAFQTNILALNAAVEAARAGEQGRGFAVVASEVRSLAQRSASAAKEIKALIAESADKVQAGTTLVARAGSTMDDVVSAVRRVTDIIAKISTASDEQSNGIEQIGRAVMQMDTVTQQNAALVEEAAAAAASLEEQAARLDEAVAAFRVELHARAQGATVPRVDPAVAGSAPGASLPALAA